MQNIKIQILGTTSSGKSTLAWEIRDFLRTKGIDVSVYDADESFQQEINDARMFHLISNGLSVDIETVQLNKPMKNEQF